MEAGSIFVVTSFYRVRLFLLHWCIGVVVVRSWFLQAFESIPEAAWIKNACGNCCKHVGKHVFLVEPTRSPMTHDWCLHMFASFMSVFEERRIMGHFWNTLLSGSKDWQRHAPVWNRGLWLHDLETEAVKPTGTSQNVLSLSLTYHTYLTNLNITWDLGLLGL